LCELRKFLLLILVLSIKLYSQSNINVELGVSTYSDPPDDFLIYRTQYVLSFNSNLHVANWVFWNLNKKWFGDVERHNRFVLDPMIPFNIIQATDSDYKKAKGYDKGHVVASEERTASEEDCIISFLYTNSF
jgi:endonuclease G, mitochondrial